MIERFTSSPGVDIFVRMGIRDFMVKSRSQDPQVRVTIGLFLISASQQIVKDVYDSQAMQAVPKAP